MSRRPGPATTRAPVMAPCIRRRWLAALLGTGVGAVLGTLPARAAAAGPSAAGPTAGPAAAPATDGAEAITLRDAMQRAFALRAQALRDGDQPYGAVVLRGTRIVGEAPSRVVTAGDPTAHAEMEAIRDAARRLGQRDLSGCVLVSSARPCRMCEAAAGWARIDRMVHGEALTDAGRPS